MKTTYLNIRPLLYFVAFIACCISLFFVFLVAIVSTVSLFEPTHVLTQEQIDEYFANVRFESEYTSLDKRTDVALNFFSGKEDISMKMKMNIYRLDSIEELKNDLNWERREFARDIISAKIDSMEKMSPYEIEDLLLSKNISPLSYFEFVPDTISYFLQYQAVWHLYFMLGSPKVHFEPREEKVWMYKHDVDAYYHPFKNTLYFRYLYEGEMDYDFTLETYFAELAHARQFQVAPCRSLLSGTSGIIRSYINAGLSTVKYILAVKVLRVDENSAKARELASRTSAENCYEDEYSRSGSLEYEAHMIIERMIENEYINLLMFIENESY